MSFDQSLEFVYLPYIYPGVLMSFLRVGSQEDMTYDTQGLSHMLEHILIPYCPDVYINGATLNNSIDFIISDVNNLNRPVGELCKILVGFFKDHNLSTHDLESRKAELDNETHLKTLTFGTETDLVATLITGKYKIFSKFGPMNDDTMTNLKSLLNYMLEGCRIVVTFLYPQKKPKNCESIFENLFPRNNTSKMKPFVPNLTFKEDVYLLDDPNCKGIISYYLLPLTQGTNISSLMDALTNQYGTAIYYDSLFTQSASYGIFMVFHEKPDFQNYYYHGNYHLKDYSNIQPEKFHLGQFFLQHQPYLFPLKPKGKPIVIFAQPSQGVLNSISLKPLQVDVKPLDFRGKLFPISTCLAYHSLSSCFAGIKRSESKSNLLKSYLKTSYNSLLAALMWSTRGQTVVERNMMYYYDTLPSRYYWPIATRDLINSPVFPYFVLQMRMYSLMEPHFHFDQAVRCLESNNYLRLETFADPELYRIPVPAYRNEIFFYHEPFKHFFHVIHKSLLRADVDRESIIYDYKKSGMLYWGDYRYYGPYCLIYGITM